MATLLIIVSEYVSEWITKGEVIDGYYNPGGVFDHVHLLLTNDDAPNRDALKRLVGPATVEVSNLPTGRPLAFRTLGWRPRLLRSWAEPAVELARTLEPMLVRCYGALLNGFVASEIKRRLGVPYTLSLHHDPDADVRRATRSPQERLRVELLQSVQNLAVRQADLVLPVYSPAVGYLRRVGVSSYEVIHNAVGHGATPKDGYEIDGRPAVILTVSRQQRGRKDPSPIIKALAHLPEAQLVLIGDGDLHDDLVALVAQLGVADRVTFHRSVPNERVLAEMAAADIYAYAAPDHEISKTCIEAAHAGLPVVVSNRGGRPAAELTGGHFELVDDSVEGFQRGLSALLTDEARRRALGIRALRHAREHWAPAILEQRVAAIYRKLATTGPYADCSLN